MAIIENELIAVVHQAGSLLLGRFLEALFVHLDAKAAGEAQRGLVELRGIGSRDLTHRSQVLIEASAVKACLAQVLRGTYESSGLALNCRAKGTEIASRSWGKEQQCLLRIGRHSENNAFVPNTLVPGFGFHEPVLGRWIRGSPQEHGHQ